MLAKSKKKRNEFKEMIAFFNKYHIKEVKNPSYHLSREFRIDMPNDIMLYYLDKDDMNKNDGIDMYNFIREINHIITTNNKNFKNDKEYKMWAIDFVNESFNFIKKYMRFVAKIKLDECKLDDGWSKLLIEKQPKNKINSSSY